MPEFNNVTADEEETKSRNHELAEHLEQLAIPNDDHFHFGGSISREHDRTTGDAIGWTGSFSVKFAWPRVLESPCPKCWTDDNGVLHRK
jgi:hypothetical protein